MYRALAKAIRHQSKESHQRLKKFKDDMEEKFDDILLLAPKEPKQREIEEQAEITRLENQKAFQQRMKEIEIRKIKFKEKLKSLQKNQFPETTIPTALGSIAPPLYLNNQNDASRATHTNVPLNVSLRNDVQTTDREIPRYAFFLLGSTLFGTIIGSKVFKKGKKG